MYKINWTEVGRILRDPARKFICVEQDPPEVHQAAFRAIGEVLKVVHNETLMAEVYLRVRRKSPFPVLLDIEWQSRAEWESGILPATPLTQMRMAFWPEIARRILAEAVRFRECAQKRRARDPATLSLDQPLQTDNGTATLHDVLADECPEDISDLLDCLGLTPRERRIAELLSEGNSQSEIAGLLALSPGRVSQLVAQLRAKFPEM